jgi:hypothetical protein
MQVAPYLTSVLSLLDKAREIVADPNNEPIELEVRMGHILRHGTFQSGISRSMFDHTIDLLNLYDGWDKYSTEWTETHDMYFNENNKTIRACIDYSKTPSIYYQIKERLLDKTLKCHLSDPGQTIFGTICDVRISISTEEEISALTLKPIVEPHFVRIKQSKDWVYKNMWKYSARRTWSGANLKEAEQAKMSIEPVYEFEIECIDIKTVLETYDNYRLASSIMLKINDFQCTPLEYSYISI